MELRQRQRIVGTLLSALSEEGVARRLQGRPDWQDELAKWLMKLGYPQPMNVFGPIEWATRLRSEPNRSRVAPGLLPRVGHAGPLSGSGDLSTDFLHLGPTQVAIALIADEGATEEEFLQEARRAYSRVREARSEAQLAQQRAVIELAKERLAWATSAAEAALPHERRFTKALARELSERARWSATPVARREVAPHRVFRELWFLAQFLRGEGGESASVGIAAEWKRQTARWLVRDTARDDAIAREAFAEWRHKRQGIVAEHVTPADVREDLRRWLGQALGRNRNIVADKFAIGGWRTLCPRDVRRYFVGRIAGGSTCQAAWVDETDLAFHEMDFGQRVIAGQKLRAGAPRRLKKRAGQIRASGGGSFQASRIWLPPPQPSPASGGGSREAVPCP